jgi:hypothetical protein
MSLWATGDWHSIKYLTKQLTIWGRVLLEKQIITQAVKEFPTFYGTRKFSTVFTRVRHWSLSWSRLIQFSSCHSYFPKIHSNIIFRPTPKSSQWFLPFRLSDPNFICIFYLSHACCMPHLSHPPWCDDPNNIYEVYKLWSSSLCSLLQSPTSSSGILPNIVLSTLFPDVILCSSLSLRDQVLDPYQNR